MSTFTFDSVSTSHGKYVLYFYASKIMTAELLLAMEYYRYALLYGAKIKQYLKMV